MGEIRLAGVNACSRDQHDIIQAHRIAARDSGQANTSSIRQETGTLLVPVSARRGPATDASVRKRPVIKKAVQGQLPLNIVAKGRFDKSEPTLHRGEDLDVPTFIRRGLALN